MKLYSATISPNGKRVRVCAAELGLALEDVRIDYEKGEQRKPEYLALNPMGKWPTLVDGDLVLWESAAILCHLAKVTPSQTLLPSEARAEADVLKWLFFTSCHIDPYFTQLVVERFIKPRRGGTTDEHATALADGWLARFVPVVEEHLRDRKYLSGETFTVADIALGCSLELAPLVSFDLERYPNIRVWLARLAERPSWRGGVPSR